MPYLVIRFDRYDTEKSTYHHLEALSPIHAVLEMYKAEGCDEDELDEIAEEIRTDIVHVDEVFSCLSGDEEDVLVYLR